MIIEKVVVGYLEENCYVISINDDCLIIDPGDDAKKIKLLVGNKNVLAILITHYHFDHIGALEELKHAYKVPVIDFNSKSKQRINKFSFEMVNTPGHKEDSVTYYFKDDNIMFTGDFIFKGTVGRCDLDGGDFSAMLKSIELIKKYDVKSIIYPGHGPESSLKEEMINNPYMKGNFNE